VDISGHPELNEFLQAGFDGLMQRQWVQAARSFQKIASKKPTDPYVFNNYGIALLQRALDMKDGDDERQRSMADAQFESSILALREAAKNAPAEGEILMNLAHALIESGRSEKALGIMNVHNLRSPDSASGLNSAAVAMFHLGQLSQAMDTFRKAGNDPIALENLSQFTKAN
jgi:Flp pilus assembly protein TadD